jgi:RHS repeat-associated protein
MGKAFERLQKQVETKEANGNTCSSNLSGKYDVTYFKELEVTEYILDRSVDYTTVLASNDEVNIYGSELVQVDDEVQVTGLNQTVVASVEGSNVKSYSYDDYGQTTDTTKGHGYNSEMKDETGLIYLRARYYDPSVGRFIQIDNNYAGEKEEVVTQNRYTYTLTIHTSL